MFFTFKALTAFLVVILPIYPSFASLSGITETTVGEYDETTILEAFVDYSSEDDLYSKETGSIRPNADIALNRDRTGLNELISYTVEQGDSFSRIADKFNISINSILWANNFSKNSILKPGMNIKIPPVSGLVYTVQAWETLQKISEKFAVDASKIADQNRLLVTQELLLWQTILIPGAIRIIDIQKDENESGGLIASNTAAKNAAQNTKTPPAKKSVTLTPKKSALALTIPKGSAGKESYLVKYNGKSKGFVWGNCTYYVATHKNVTWRWNANQWLRNAAAAGVSTGSKPVPGAIISFSGRGYNPYYGHVWIVKSVEGDSIIVSDMNYRKLNEVTVRKIPKNDATIRGYIYVD
jgi:surface antigen/LysM repeat protein